MRRAIVAKPRNGYMMKKDETFAWVVENTTAKKRSVWAKKWRSLTGRDDDDDDHDLPGPNAGATLWPGLPRVRKAAAAFA